MQALRALCTGVLGFFMLFSVSFFLVVFFSVVQSQEYVLEGVETFFLGRSLFKGGRRHNRVLWEEICCYTTSDVL